MQNKRNPHWRAIVAAVALALLATACGGGGPAGGQASGGAECPEGGVALAFFGPLTGPNSPQLGINIRDAARLAVDQYMEGNPACPVELLERDSQGDPAQAPGLAQELVQNEKVVAIIGPVYSGESNVADPIFNEAGLPTVTPSATNAALSSHDWEIFHRAVATDAQQGPAVARYIRDELGAMRVAVIDDRSEYGLPLADSVRAELGDLAVHNDAIDTAAQDYSSTVNGVRGAGDVDAIFFGGYYQQAGLLLKQLRDAGVTATFLSGDGSRDEQLIAIAGEPAAQGALLSCPCAPTEELQGGQEFVAAYSERHGPPGIYAAEGFDVTNMLLEAISEGNVDRAAISEWLNTASYQGVSKTLQFEENGELPSSQIYLYRVEGSRLVGVGPIG